MSSPPVATPLSNSPQAIRLATLLVMVWLVAMGSLLWHFEGQRLADSQQLLHFDARNLPAPPAGASAGAGKALYFLPAGCRCNASALAEITRLHRLAVAPPVQFVFDAAGAEVDGALPLSAAERARWREHVPATPAVALWDAHDKLIYFGPVNVVPGCGERRSYLQMAFQASRQQPAAAFGPWDVVACRCRDSSGVDSSLENPVHT